MKSDWTLRRFQNAEDVEADVPTKVPRSYRLQDIEFIVQVSTEIITSRRYTGFDPQRATRASVHDGRAMR